MVHIVNKESCKYCVDCGGCDYIDLEYPKTLDIKLSDFKGLAQSAELAPANIQSLSITASPSPFNYRTRCQLQVLDGKIGFFKKRSHELIEIKNCLMLDERLNQKISELKFPANYKGKIELYIKDAKVFERLVEKKYDNLFYQVNEAVNELMKDHLIKLLEPEPSDNILELYCGQGNFTYSITKASAKTKITGIDINSPTATSPEFINTDVVAGIDRLIMQNRLLSFNKLVLDPPRAGTGTKVLEKLNKPRFEKIVYISCNPETLIRDAGFLSKMGYKWASSQLFDMFPFTKYTESVNLFNN